MGSAGDVRLAWSPKKAEAARARWPSDLQAGNVDGSASHLSRLIHKARFQNGGARTIPFRGSFGSQICRDRRAMVRLEAEGLACDHRYCRHEQCAGHARHHEGRSLPDPDASESRRHRAAIPTLIAIRVQAPICVRPNQTPPRGCRLSEAAISLNSLGVLALPYVDSATTTGRAGDGIGRDRVCTRGKSLGGSS